MPEHLRRITIPTADGSRHELSVMTPQDLDPLLQRLERLERVGTLAEMLLSEGPAKLAEHLILEAVALPPGDYTGVLDTAEHLCEGTLYRLAMGNYRVTPELIASHFPEVAAIVTPMDASLYQPPYAYRSSGTVFAKGGLVLSRDLPAAWNRVQHELCPRNVDSIQYWNFDVVPNLYIADGVESGPDRTPAPYVLPTYINGFVNMHKAKTIHLIDTAGRSRLTSVYGVWDNIPDNVYFLNNLFKDWPGQKWISEESGMKGHYEDYPHNEVKLREVPSFIKTKGYRLESLFAGLTNVENFPMIELTGGPGTHLFQRNPDRLPDASIKRRCKIRHIGSDANDENEPQTDLSGLVNWNKDDLAYTIDNCKTAAVSPWKILLSKDAYASLTAAQRATLTSKGFTVVNAG